ncbi:hypothetical protein PPYR_14941 [Photinus pyralis]|uniref:Uncharacterized protein n=3 Tax=Photinus pyralis TaxID=7054 RepID=A0A5N4A0K6_PHOPY|nr:hypothetical protein PPYR_14941 [Photinus pyralis]
MLDIVVDRWESIPSENPCPCKPPECKERKEASSTSTLSLRRESDESHKSGRRDSPKRKLSIISEKSQASSNNSRSSMRRNSKKSASRDSLAKNPVDSLSVQWIVNVPDESAVIRFRNGDCYEGGTSKRVMHGRGKYKWADGSIYEGDFVCGFATGHGTLQYPDLTMYTGEFCNSLLHGYGVINVSASTLRYSGNWKGGKKHGQGWLLYETDDWYDGEWFEDQRQGVGVRSYKSGEIYQGHWSGGSQDGSGVFVWCSNDVYKGRWTNGKMNGYGEYTWNTFINRSFTFPVENVYKGNWTDGTREGTGTMHFGYDNGLSFDGEWVHDEKHGSGTLTCGNGTVVHQDPLFQNDKLIIEPGELHKNCSAPHSSALISSRRNLLESKSDKQFAAHLPAETTDFSYYYSLAVERYTTELYKIQLSTDYQHCEDESQTLISNFQSHQSEVERREMQNAILANLPKLYRVYNKYATIATNHTTDFKPTLIRYFLWQMLRDFDYITSDYSLVEIDLILLQNPNSGLKWCHDPFEEVFFWQFLQLLVCLAWKFHAAETVTGDCKNDGVLATIFARFLTDVVYARPYFTSACSLFEYRDVLPFKQVYSLYKSLGEPHSARDFLSKICTSPGFPIPCENRGNFSPQQGVNAIAIGGNLMYLTDESGPFVETARNPSGAPCQIELSVLQSLRSKRIVQCLCDACPQMKKNGVIINIEYQLTFLEFYDTLLKCGFAVVELKRKNEERLRNKAELLKSMESIKSGCIKSSTKLKKSVK